MVHSDVLDWANLGRGEFSVLGGGFWKLFQLIPFTQRATPIKSAHLVSFDTLKLAQATARCGAKR